MQYTDNSRDSVDWGQPINWSHSLTTGLRMWCLAVPNRLGFGTTQWRDMARHNHGTLTNMAPTTDWGLMARPGGWGSLSVPSSGDYVTFGSGAAIQLTGEFTLAFWAYRLSTPAGRILLNGDYPTNNIGLYGDSGQETLKIFQKNDAYASSVSLESGEWHHIVFRRTGSSGSWQLKIFKDSVDSYTANKTIDPSGGAYDITLGHSSSGPPGIAFDDIAIWPERVLTPREIHDWYISSLMGHRQLFNRMPVFRYSTQEEAGGGSVVPKGTLALLGVGV